MSKKRHTAEEIVAKLQQVDVLTAQGRPVCSRSDPLNWRDGGHVLSLAIRVRRSQERPGQAPEGTGSGERQVAPGRVRSHPRQDDPERGCQGKLLSPARRRACVEHVKAELGLSERQVCRVLGQHRSTQRKILTSPDDEAALTADIIALALQYGRYGYRRITALLREAGWRVNKKRVERIWR
jgi:putative transposase